MIYFYDKVFAWSSPGDHDALLVVRALHSRARQLRHQIRLPDTIQPQIAEICVSMTRESATPRYGSAGMLKSLLQRMLMLLWRETSVGNDVDVSWSWAEVASSAEAIESVLSYISAHLHEPLHAETLAEHAGVSRSLFFPTFKRYTGMTLVQYVNRLRIAQATRLLQETSMSVIQVGETVGFGSPSNFFTTFKSVTGSSPLQYRNYTGATDSETPQEQLPGR